MSPELISALGAAFVGALGTVVSLIMATRKRISDEDLPAYKQRTADLEQLRKTDREEIERVRKADRQDYERRIAAAELAREQDRAEYQTEVNDCRNEVLALDRQNYELRRFIGSKGHEVPAELQRPPRRRQPPRAAGSDQG